MRPVLTRLERRLRRGDEGNAVVEFLGVTLVLLLPLVYLVLVVSRLEAAAFAVEGAAREASRVFVAADDEQQATARAIAVTGVALADQGIHDDPAHAIAFDCAATRCLTPGSEVAVTVAVRVPLPFVPTWARSVVPLEVPVSARHVAVVDRFREAG